MWALDHREGWVPKNWCFWTMVLQKTLESTFDCKEIESILKEINSEYSLEGLIMKLKLQYFGRLMWRADSEKTPILGKIEGRKRMGWQRINWLDGITTSMDMSLNQLQQMVKARGKPGVLQSMVSQRVVHD